jgi:hypothetical protein
MNKLDLDKEDVLLLKPQITFVRGFVSILSVLLSGFLSIF